MPEARGAQPPEIGKTSLHLVFGDPNMPNSGTTLWIKDPDDPRWKDHTLHGKPLTDISLLGGYHNKKDTPGYVTILKPQKDKAGRRKSPSANDPAMPYPNTGETLSPDLVGGILIRDDTGKSILLKRSDLLRGKPDTTAQDRHNMIALGEDDVLEADTAPATLPSVKPEPRATGTRYVNTEFVTRESLEKDTTFQAVLAKMREVVQEVKQLRKELDDLTVLPAVVEQIREGGAWSDPAKARDPNYQALMTAINSRGLKSDEALLASEYLLDQAKRQTNELAMTEWTKRMQTSADTKDIRRSVLDMVEHGNEGSVQFSKDAVEMSMTDENERNAGYQDLRAAQITNDYLLDTYDATARKRWVDKNGLLTDAGMQERREYHTFLFQMLQGKVSAGKKDLATKLRVKFDELRKLSPDAAIVTYQGLIPGDKDRLIVSVKRWQDKHGVEPYRTSDLDLMATKGLLLIERRAAYPKLYDTIDVFYKKALKESGARPTTPAAAPPAGVAVEPPPSAPAPTKPAAAPAVTPPAAAPASAEALPAAKPPVKEEPGEPEKPPVTPPKIPPPQPTTPLTELHATVAAAKGQLETDVTRTNWRGKEVQKKLSTRELIEMKAAELGRLMMTEVRRKWDPGELANRPWHERWGQRGATLLERAWRGMLTEMPHYIKEKRHAMKLFAATGLEGDLPYELYSEIDRRARAGVEADRTGAWRKFRGFMGDFWGEFTAQERDLHRKRIEIATKLRADFETNPYDTTNPLHGVVWGDYKAQSDLAGRIGETAYGDTLHTALGEKRTEASILLEKDSAPRTFIMEQVLKPIIRDALTRGNGTIDEKLEVGLRTKLSEYWLSDEFQGWRSSLPQAQQEKLDMSLSYSTNIIDVAKDVLVPNVIAAREHYQKLDELDFDIKLTLGTARFGPNGEIPSQTWGEKRLALNERVWNKLAERARTSGQHQGLFGADTITRGTRAAYLLAGANELVRTEWWALAPWAATRAAMTGLRIASTPFGAIAPNLVGAAAAGTISGFKEYARLRGMRAEFDIEETLGYTRPREAVRAQEMRARAYNKVEMGTRASELQVLLDKDSLTKDEALLLVGYIADGDARSSLGAARNINLWKVTGASNDVEPVPPLSKRYQEEEKLLDVARAKAKLKLTGLLAGNATLKGDVMTALGQAADGDVGALLTSLTDAQRTHLLQGTTVASQFQVALGARSITEAESVNRRDKAFESWRRVAALKHAGGVAVASFIFSEVTQEAVAPAVKTLYNGIVNHNWAWQSGRLTESLFGTLGGIRGAGVLPLAADAEVVHGVSDVGRDTWGVMHFSQGVKMQGGNLVFDDGRGHIQELIKNFEPHFSGNGQITQGTIDQLHAVGVNFDKTQLWNDVVSSGSHPITIGDHEYLVPKELQLVSDGAGGQSWVLDGLHDKAGHLLPRVVVMEHVDVVGGNIQHPGEVIDILDRSHWLARVPGGTHFGAPVPDNMPDVNTMIPPGTHLVQTGAHTFNLVSDADPKDVLLHKMTFDPDTGKFTNLADPAVRKEIDLHNLFVSETETAGPGGPGGMFSIRAGFLDDKTRYMGHNTIWEWMDRTLDPKSTNAMRDLDKNAFRAWHHWDGNDNARIVDAEAGGIHRVVHRVANGFRMSDGNVGYENSLDYNRLPDNLYIDKVPETLFSDANIARMGKLMEDAVKEADAWKSAHPGANVDDVLTYLKGHDELQYLAYKHGYIGQYFTESDWGHFRKLFEGPTSSWQTTITQGGAAWGVKADIVENVLTYGPGGGTDFPFIPVSWHRPLEAPEQKKPSKPGYPGYGYRGYGYPGYGYPGYRGYGGYGGYGYGYGYRPGYGSPGYRGLETSDDLQQLNRQQITYGSPIQAVSADPQRKVDSPLKRESENLTPEFYRSRLSERLRNNPNTNLNYMVEVPEYLGKQDAAYRAELEGFLKQEGMSVPMDEHCDAIVCIPVYTLGEGKLSEHALEQYYLQMDKSKNKQAVDANKFELLIFLNHPKNGDKGRLALEAKLGRSISVGAESRVKSGKPEVYDTEEVIRQFQQKHPELRIRVMKKEFDEKPQWGTIIKTLYDTALLRSLQRPNAGYRDPTIITNDIDVVRMSPTYVRDILQTMDFNEIASWRDPNTRKIDALVGNTDKDPEAYKNVPEFLLAERFYQYFEMIRRGNHSTQGRNTAIRASTYAAMGGANPHYDDGADGELAAMIWYGRNDGRYHGETIPYLHKAWLQTDPRREIDSWLKGTALADNWDEWSAYHLYGTDWKEKLKTHSPKDIDHIEKEFLSYQINRLIQRFFGGWFYKDTERALAHLGLRTKAAYQKAIDPVASLDDNDPKLKETLDVFGLHTGDYHRDNGNIVVDRNDYHVENDRLVVIENVDSVKKNLRDFVSQKRWGAADRKVKRGLEGPQMGTITTKARNNVGRRQYAVEYLNYEEFNDLKNEIYVADEYYWSPPPDNNKPRVIDLGGHIGMSVLHWKSVSPDVDITVVEANPSTTDVLKRNLHRNHMDDVRVVNAASSSKDGTVTLYLPKEGVDFHWGDFVDRTPSDPSQYDTIAVPTVKLSSLIGGKPVDLLKIDIEGSEFEVLKEARPNLHLVNEIIMEFHHDPSNPANSLKDTLDILKSEGYQITAGRKDYPLDLDSLDLSQKIFFTLRAKRP